MRSRSWIAVLLCLLAVSTASADVCVWRDPARTMSQLFPEARDYRTVDLKIPPSVRARIEQRLGQPLADGESDSWTYYTVLGANGKPLATVIADAEKGDYGVIEIVMGLSLDGHVHGVYVQRSRERKTADLMAPAFLSQFAGKTVKDPLAIGPSLHGVDGAEAGSRAIAFAVRKMLVFHDELTRQP